MSYDDRPYYPADFSIRHQDGDDEPKDLTEMVKTIDTAVTNSVIAPIATSVSSGFISASSIGDFTTLPGIVQTTISKCDHVMGEETELQDGQVAGFCVVCGDKIKGRRMVGGYGLAKLKDAIVDALGDADAMAGLLDEIDRVELMLKVEEQSLRSAYDMIEMARKMVKTIIMPDAVEEDPVVSTA